MNILIDRIEDINMAEITFSSIRKMYGTGRAFTFKNYRGEKSVHYRHGCMTAIGDIEKSVWQQIVRILISEKNERELFQNLKSWLKDSKIVFRDENELDDYALQLHAERIFDCTEWVDFVGFNTKYRPEIVHRK